MNVLLGALIVAFSLASCAKPESAAERNAEIDRRVDERLAAANQAEERERLAQHQAALENRERALAAQEASFAAMTASLPPEPTATPVDTERTFEVDSPAPQNSYSTYSDAGGQLYPEEYGYGWADQSYLVAEPYCFVPATSFVTIVNQNTLIVTPRRGRGRGGRGQHRPMVPNDVPPQTAIPDQPADPRPPVVPRQPVVPRRPIAPPQVVTAPRPTSGMPTQTGTHRPARRASAPQVVNRRPAARVALQGNR